MTEAEAKTKACFKAATFGASQQLADGPGPHCIASACMAWRPGVKSKFKDARSGKLLDRDLTGHGEWVTVDGHCGLAGAGQ